MSENLNSIASLFYEIGTLRFTPRSHQQVFLTNNPADNISSHSHRVAAIAYVLGQLEGVDANKCAVMGIFHDLVETRSGDQNWVHKRYVEIDDREIFEDQTKELPQSIGLKNVLEEYSTRESPESIVAKDADRLDQILLIREYAWQGNREAMLWEKGKGDHIGKLETVSARLLAEEIYNQNPSAWWNNIWTSERKKH